MDPSLNDLVLGRRRSIAQHAAATIHDASNAPRRHTTPSRSNVSASLNLLPSTVLRLVTGVQYRPRLR